MPVACTVCTGCGQDASETDGQESRKPLNIIYIMSDDHSYQTIGAYGHGLIETPNIDRLADSGMIFTQSFVANSISGPSRGFTDNTRTFDGSQQTFPKLLRQAGYETAVIGKWHLTSDPTGFDYWNILIGQGQYYNPTFIDNGERRVIPGYATDITTDLALDWLENKRDNFYDDYEGRPAASRRSCTRNSCGCRNSTTTPWSRNWLRGISKIQ